MRIHCDDAGLGQCLVIVGTIPTYNPDAIKLAPEKEVWRKWEIVYTGNVRVPFWIVRVPKDIISGHGGLWSDNSIAMFAAIFRLLMWQIHCKC